MKRETRLTMIVAFFVFIALFGVTSLFNSTLTGITGNVVMERPVDGQVAIQELLRSPEFKVIGSGAKICINVKVGDNEIRGYKIRKSGDLFKVSQSKSYCEGSNDEDIVITFESYSALLSAKDLDGLEYFNLPSAEDEVKLWQSRFIRVGGLVKQDEEFNNRYCKFLTDNFNSELRIWGINCDVDEEKPNALLGFFGEFWWMILIGLFVVAIVIVGFSLYNYRDNSDDDEIEQETLEQLHKYIENSRKLGYGDYKIRDALIESGWDYLTVKAAFEKVRKFHLSSVVDRFEKIIELPFVDKDISDEEDYENEEEFENK